MIFLALKTEDGRFKGKIAFYCRMLGGSRQGFYKYLANKDRPWKYQNLAEAMKEIVSEDECNDTYGWVRMYQALLLKREFHWDAPLEKCVTDITEIKAFDGKLYVSAIFDCFDLGALGLAMETDMKAELYVHTLENALPFMALIAFRAGGRHLGVRFSYVPVAILTDVDFRNEACCLFHMYVLLVI